jgi:Ca2+-binding EF-hand superfamily protein
MHTTSVPRQAKQPKAVRKSGKIKKQAKDRAKGDRANAVPLSERRKKLEEMKDDFAKQEKKRKKNATKKQATKGRAGQITWWQKFHKKHLERRNSVIAFEDTSAAAAAVWELGLDQKDLRRLKNKFELIDLDGSGEIDYEEFFELIEDTRSPYTDALFALIDQDGSGAIDFSEFIHVLSTYCMYNREDILRFCFDTFDADGSGAIEEDEFIGMMKALNNAAPMFPGNFAKALQEFDQNDDGMIDFNEFREMSKLYPILFYPAFRLQDGMQRATLGEKQWVKVHEFMKRKAEIEQYRETHGGSMPPISRCTKMRMFLGKPHPYARFMRPSFEQIQEQKKEQNEMFG